MTNRAFRLDVAELRQAIQDEYAEVAHHPEQGFHQCMSGHP